MTSTRANSALLVAAVVFLACSERSAIYFAESERTCAELVSLPHEGVLPSEVVDVVWLTHLPGKREPSVVNWDASRINGTSGRIVSARGTPWLIAAGQALSLEESSAERTAGSWLDCERGTVDEYVAFPLAPGSAAATGGLREVRRYPETESEWPAERTSDLTLVGTNLIAIARGPDGLRVLRRDEKQRVSEVSHLGAALGDDYNDVSALDGRYVAVAAKQRGLVIVDLAEPSQPTVVADGLPWISSRDAHSVFVDSVFVEGDRVYLAQAPAVGAGAVTAFDVTVRSEPRELWRWTAEDGHDAHDVAVRGNRAYVSSIRGGITVLEWHDAAEPVVAARYPGIGAHSGTYAGGAGAEFWLWGEERAGGRHHCIEVTRDTGGVYLKGAPLPSKFVVGMPHPDRGWLTSAASPHQAECRDNLCFLAHYQLGVRVVEILRTAAGLRPEERPIAWYPTWRAEPASEVSWLRGATGIALELPWIYVTDSENGLIVLQYTPLATPPTPPRRAD
jgi:hypothetical protein